MLAFFLYLFVLFLLISSKKDIYIYYIAVIYMILLFAFCAQKADLENYKHIFFDNKLSIDLLFVAYLKLLSFFHFNIYGVYFFLGAFNIILLGKIIRENSSNPNKVVFLYMLVPFLVDTIQIRNFAGYVLVLYGIMSLDTHKHSLIKYFFCIILATGFHTICIIYIFLPFLRKFKTKIFLLFLIVFLISLVPVLINILLDLIPNKALRNKLAYYLIEVGSSVDIRNVILCCSIIIQSFLINIIDNLKDKISFSIREKDLFSFVARINIFNLLFVGLVLLGNTNFIRVTRNMIPLNSICFFNYYCKKRNIIMLYIFVFSALMQGIVATISAYPDIFNNNFILNWVNFLPI